MNKLKFCLVFLSLASLFNVCKPFLPRYQFNTVFTEFDKENFGNAILSAISLQMFADTPVDQILTMLNEVSELLDQEQQEEDQEIYQIRQECNSQLESLKNSIEFHQSLIQQLQAGLESHSSLINATEMKEQDIKKRINIINDMLNKEKQRNNKSVEFYQIKVQQLNNATSTVNEALSLVSHLKTDASFIQLQKFVSKVSTKLMQLKHTHHQITPLLSILSVLGQITQNGDQEALDQIIKLLNKIKQSYENDMTKEEEIERLRLEKFNNYISQLAQESMSQSNKLELNEKEKQQYKEIFADIQNSLKFHNQQLVKLAGAEQRTKDFCVDKNEEYEKTTKYRLADRNALNKLIPNFKEKAKALKKYLQDRAGKEF